MREFQALVPRGSICIPVPDRAGPITNHLYTKHNIREAMDSESGPMASGVVAKFKYVQIITKGSIIYILDGL